MINVTEIIDRALRSGAQNLHINVWIEDQILFQILPSKDLVQFGYMISRVGSLSEVHSFNKNKTKTPNVADEFGDDFFYFEDPKNYHNYAKEVNMHPASINDLINDRVAKLYKVLDKEIRVEVVDY